VVLKKALPELSREEVVPADKFAYRELGGLVAFSGGYSGSAAPQATRSVSALYGAQSSTNSTRLGNAQMKTRISRTVSHKKWAWLILQLSRYYCIGYEKYAELIMAQPGDAQGDFPILVHPKARVIGRYQFPAGEPVGDLARVQYIKTEERNIPKRLIAHYERVVPRVNTFKFADGVWLTALEDDQETGRTISTDVFIQTLEDHATEDIEQLLRVEILMTDIPTIPELR